MISNDEIKQDPSANLIPYHLVDAVCEVPYGAYPGTMHGEYFSDGAHLKAWLSAEKEPETFSIFLDHHLYNCRDHEDYIRRNGGLVKMQSLRAKELLLK